jgi:spore germination protein GerM
MYKRLFTIAVLLAGVLVACGIPDNGHVSSIQDNDLRNLSDTIPPTSTSTIPVTTVVLETTTIAVITPTTIATDLVALYFITGGRLNGYPTPLVRPATTSQVIAALQLGAPPGDPGVGIRSAVPLRAKSPISVNENDSGIATIELPSGFFELIPTEDQLLAIGQIVLSVTEVGGVGQVLFTQNGQPIGVPRRDGGFSNGSEPLSRRDYVDLLNPPETTTTTTTTTTVAPPTSGA